VQHNTNEYSARVNVFV